MCNLCLYDFPRAETLKLKIEDGVEGEKISRTVTINYLGVNLDENFT